MPRRAEAWPGDPFGTSPKCDSLEEVRELIREGIAFHIAGLREDGLPVPKPSAKAGEFIEVGAA